MSHGSSRADDRRPAGQIAERAWNAYRGLNERIVAFLRRVSLTLPRVSLGIVFVWFGALKLAALTPVTELVARSVYGVDPSWFVPALGGVEVLAGVGLVGSQLRRPRVWR